MTTWPGKKPVPPEKPPPKKEEPEKILVPTGHRNTTYFASGPQGLVVEDMR